MKVIYDNVGVPCREKYQLVMIVNNMRRDAESFNDISAALCDQCYPECLS
jgi:hypothetical protein